ncbi:MAG: DUF805 domain-containing protein [Lysobacter sp.]|nr:DUF805 domain-containing protein [Lysobacter sp.]
MDWYLKVLKNYVNFSGRARRKEYWMFFLINVLIGFGLGIVDGMLGLRHGAGAIGTLGLLYNLFILLPSIAVGTRRLHDTGRSGWWQLIALVPILGVIVLIVWYASEGESGSNAYGDDPKADGGDGVPAMA